MNQRGYFKEICRRGMLIVALLLIIGVEWHVADAQATINYTLRYEKNLERFRADPEGYLNPYRTIESHDEELQKIENTINRELKYFPVEKSYIQEIKYCDSWYGERTYGGDRVHEGTDIMDIRNEPGRIPVISMTDGVVRNMGWLTLGGWRIGIESEGGIYYYYAHLYSYAAGLKPGDPVYAGQLLGFMGNSGYGEEGTTGMFDTHLHIGIYFYQADETEISINPYLFLKKLQEKQGKV